MIDKMRHESLSKRAEPDGHFGMLRRFVAILAQMLSGFRKFWCLDSKNDRELRRLTYQFTSLTPPFHRKTLV